MNPEKAISQIPYIKPTLKSPLSLSKTQNSFNLAQTQNSLNMLFISNTTLATNSHIIKKEDFTKEDFFLPFKKNYEDFSEKEEELNFDQISFEGRKRSFTNFNNYQNPQKKKKTEESLFAKKKTKNQKKKCFCKCKNSNCLRLHCSCFKILGYCNDNCKCKNCLNSKEFKDARNFVIQKTKIIYKKAFKPKTVNIKEIGGVKINTDGCNCEKGCFNNYCGCKKINGSCSPICRCTYCQNNKIFLSKKEIQKIYKPCSRKKHKLIINFKDYKKFGEDDKNIVFETYRKGEDRK